jgi:hypothetical protein
VVGPSYVRVVSSRCVVPWSDAHGMQLSCIVYSKHVFREVNIRPSKQVIVVSLSIRWVTSDSIGGCIFYAVDSL